MHNMKRIRRRTFLTGVAGLAALQLQPGSAVTAAPRRACTNVGTVTCADFAPYVGSTFVVQAGGTPVALTLTQASDPPIRVMPGKSRGRRLRKSFSLLFQGPAGPALSQDTYTLAHGQLGSLTLFLVPVGKPNKRRYEAIFG